MFAMKQGLKTFRIFLMPLKSSLVIALRVLQTLSLLKQILVRGEHTSDDAGHVIIFN